MRGVQGLLPDYTRGAYDCSAASLVAPTLICPNPPTPRGQTNDPNLRLDGGEERLKKVLLVRRASSAPRCWEWAFARRNRV